MKILHTADWHLGKKLNDFSRIDEQRQVLEEICVITEENQIDVVVIAGDLFDSFNPPIEAIELLYNTVHRLADHGNRAIIAIAGNHDSADRIETPDTLARASGIIFNGFPNTKTPVFQLSSGLEISRSDHGFFELKLPNSKELLRIISTPYANEVRLKSFFGTDTSEDNFRTLVKEKWHYLAKKYCDIQGFNLLLAHLFVTDGKGLFKEPEDERSVIFVGGAAPIYTEDIPKEIDYTALGHLHRFHNLATENEAPIIYSGSLLEYSLSETNQQKYVAIIETKENQLKNIQKISLKGGKTLKRKRFENLANAINWLEENQDTFVEVTLASDSFLTAQTQKELFKAHKGIIGIIPEIKGINTDEYSKAPDIQEKVEVLFEQYFQLKHQKPLNKELSGLLHEILNMQD